MSAKISVVMPVYNVEKFVKQAIISVLEQTLTDFELLIVNDCATDNSLSICESFSDPRIRIINHPVNRGLAAARNTGIRHAIGRYVAFIDSDDLWHPTKLEKHAKHLDDNPKLGLSFSRSAFITFDGEPMDFYQMPKLTDIDGAHLLCRNPVGNGSAPVLRRSALNDIRFAHHGKQAYSCYFDEDFRQSEDIECWFRLITTTKWKMEGLPEPLTFYRLNHGGLSANLLKQLKSWEQMVARARIYAPKVLAKHEQTARAYQLRYLARQAIRINDGKMAATLVTRALATSPRIIVDETSRTFTTLSAAYLQWLLPQFCYQYCEQLGQRMIGSLQKYRINREAGTKVTNSLGKADS
ncbi:glycosyltransferase family 2 protein [Shewanella sp. WXL01]|uniref:Glycosyltransferase family 2 protein n=1 Tax=Shewanella maritima TaxID=2520507 RepID=A0A411PL52_9GAMM|nr:MULTISPECIES: glycosyltransferase family 2 protein [Shewanella]NKF51715.1 glycosyltransferase family 2 protein [Shewanella sp. WXL01]QBF84221.1 glycosyltransferase family 2 protein [Shewanella maritima]